MLKQSWTVTAGGHHPLRGNMIQDRIPHECSRQLWSGSTGNTGTASCTYGRDGAIHQQVSSPAMTADKELDMICLGNENASVSGLSCILFCLWE